MLSSSKAGAFTTMCCLGLCLLSPHSELSQKLSPVTRLLIWDRECPSSSPVHCTGHSPWAEHILQEPRCLSSPWGSADFNICRGRYIVFPGSGKMHLSSPNNICHCEQALCYAESSLLPGICAAEVITEEALQSSQNFLH